jgi:hypothetical protein
MILDTGKSWDGLTLIKQVVDGERRLRRAIVPVWDELRYDVAENWHRYRLTSSIKLWNGL